MAGRRPLHQVAAFAIAICAAAACGGDGGSGGPDGGGAGGTGGGTNACIPPNTACTAADQAAINQYVGCLQNACDSSYVTCYGANYRSGSYAGPCGTLVQCVTACGCAPTSACTGACGGPTTECNSCLATLGTCTTTAACTRPACYAATP